MSRTCSSVVGTGVLTFPNIVPDPLQSIIILF